MGEIEVQLIGETKRRRGRPRKVTEPATVPVKGTGPAKTAAVTKSKRPGTAKQVCTGCLAMIPMETVPPVCNDCYTRHRAGFEWLGRRGDKGYLCEQPLAPGAHQ